MSEPAADKQGERWEAPAIDGSDGRGFLTAARLQELQKQAYDEAFAEGHEKGLRAGEDELRCRIERLDLLLTALGKPFEELDEIVEEQLVELAITIARQLFRREIRIDPGHVIGVVRETIPLLPAASRDIEVHLHPDDAELVREASAGGSDEGAWGIVEDPLITRGGCRVSSANSLVDARAETRFKAIVDAITGDERAK